MDVMALEKPLEFVALLPGSCQIGFPFESFIKNW
jgi:hypothetical protein